MFPIGARVCHRIPDYARAYLELPEHLAAPGVDGLEPAVERSVKHDATGGCERATPHGIRLLDSPDLLAGRGVPGDEFAAIATRPSFLRRVASDEWRAGDVRDRARLKIHAEIVRRNVEETCLRGERRGLLILAALEAGTDILHVLVLRRLLRFHDIGAAGRHVDSCGPVHRDERFRQENFAGCAIDRVCEAIAIKVHEHFPHLALDWEVDEDVLVHGVVVPHVVRRHLECPHHLAGVRIARQNRGSPLVVTGALVLIPRPGIAGAVINEIERGIIGEPAPHRATTCFPCVARPRRSAEVLPPIVGVERLEFRTDLHVLVGPDVVGAPDFLSSSCIERGDPSAHSHLATARPHDDFPFHHYRRHRDRLAAGEITHLRAPYLIAGDRVDRDGVPVEQIIEDPSVGVRGTAIHHVAAGSADCLLGVVRTELPLERLPGLRKVDRVRDVGIRRDDVHRVAHDQWLALVSAQHSGRECPGYVEVRGVLRSDRSELAVARAGVVAGGHLPFTGWAGVRDGDSRARCRCRPRCGARRHLRLRAGSAVGGRALVATVACCHSHQRRNRGVPE